MKKLLFFLSFWLLAATTWAADEMLSNPGFEVSSSNAFFGTVFEDWYMSGVVLAAETTDKVEGEQALKVTETTLANNILYQDIDNGFEAGATYRLRIKYKVLTSQNGNDIKLDCFWNHPQTEELNQDSVKLRTDFFTADTWTEKTVETTYPEGATKFCFRVIVAKKAVVLFDDFSFQKVEGSTTVPEEPTLTVTPTTFTEVSTHLNVPVDFPTVTIKQASLTNPVTVTITGTDAKQFGSSIESTTEATQNVVFTYNPTAIGRHTATVTIESAGHYELTQTFTLKGYCIDPNNPPSMTLTPATIPAFTAKVDEKSTLQVQLSSENCIDYIYASVEHIEGTAFSISSSMFVKNIPNNLTITFAPKQAGNYHSKINFSTLEGTPLTVDLYGTATEGDTPDEDPLIRTFNWDMSNPTDLLFEHFDDAVKNENLQIEGWQNVTPKGNRPWWGDVLDGDKMAKVTGYVNGLSSDEEVEMWLVTPPLNYNVEGKTFTFRIMGQNIFENCPTTLDLYYIDTIPNKPTYFQRIDVGIPSIPDQNGEWSEIHLNLEGQSINDVFFMAFKYTGKWGNENGVIYYIDDVSWGRTDLPEIKSDSAQVTMIAAQGIDQVSGKITITGKNLTEDIKLSLSGANPSKFKLSTNTLPAEGGSFTVTFNSNDLGVHEAYIKLSSRGAADAYIPLSVLVKEQSGIETSGQQPISIVQAGKSIRISAEGLQQISLYNPSGVWLNQYAAENGNALIPDLSAGMYILNVVTAHGQSIHKVIVR